MIERLQIEEIKTDEEAIDAIDSERWRHGFLCPRCQCIKGYRHKNRKLIECAQCGKQTSPTANTIFHGTRKPLLDLKLLDLMSRGCNLSTSAISKAYKIGYATLWYHANIARLALRVLGLVQRSFIDCDSLRRGLTKQAKGDEVGERQPDLFFREEAPEILITAVTNFLILVFTGVSRKYVQAYLTQYELFLNQQPHSLAELLEAAFRSRICRRELRNYRSPPAVLIDAHSFVPA